MSWDGFLYAKKTRTNSYSLISSEIIRHRGLFKATLQQNAHLGCTSSSAVDPFGLVFDILHVHVIKVLPHGLPCTFLPYK